MKEPQSDYHDPECEFEPQIIVNSQADYYDSKVRNQAENQGISISALFTRLASAARKKQIQDFNRAETKQTKTYQLANSGQWFQSTIGGSKLREWITQSIKDGENVYLVVGYYTMVDTQVMEGGSSTIRTSAQLNLPATLVALPAGSVFASLPPIADPSFGSQSDQREQFEKQFVATGEQIGAVQYRKLRFSTLSPENLDKALLEGGNRWHIFSNLRGPGIGNNNVVQADIEDDWKLEDNFRAFDSDEDIEIFFNLRTA